MTIDPSHRKVDQNHMNEAKPLTVLLLIDSLRMGGAERITVALLPHLDRERVKPILGVMSTEGESPLGDQIVDIQRINFEAKRLIDPIAFWRYVKIVRQEKPDIIHAQLQYATVFAGLGRIFTKTPVIVTRHLIGDDSSNWKERLRSKLEQMIIRRFVDCVICVSDAAKDYYASLTRLPESRFKTIYNGIDLERFVAKQDKATLRNSLGLPVDKSIITMVGVMRPGKGHQILLDAAQSISDALFLLVGDGELRPQLEKEAQSLGDRVRFLGQRLDVPEILNASDIFVLPSDSEALPTVLIEAGAASLPCIASDVGGTAEIIQDRVTGIIIPPRRPDQLAEEIRFLLDAPEKRLEMGQQAFKRISQVFTLDQQAEDTMQLYEAIVSSAIDSKTEAI